MKITRFTNESICINHQMTVTLHAQTMGKCNLFVSDHITQESYFEVVAKGDELVISELGTRMVPVDFAVDGAGQPCVTFDIEHDPQVIVHRSEMEAMH